MINTTNIKITTSQSNRQTDPNKSPKSLLGHLDFGANINKALKNPPKSLSQNDGLSQTNQSFKKKGHPFYLGSAPKGPFAPEKALNPVSVNRRDLTLLKKILFQSGLSRKQVKGFLKDLAQSSPHEDLNPAQFFQKQSLLKPSVVKSQKGTKGVLGKMPRKDSSPLEELDPAQFFQKRSLPKPSVDKSQKSAGVDPWVMPHLETVLQRFGLSSQEINQAFQATENGQGRLNWTQFVINLKKIQTRSNNGIRITVDSTSGRVIGPKHESTGLQGSHPQKSGQISLSDFITALERIRVGSNPKNTVAQPQQIGTDQNSEKISLLEINQNQVSSPSIHAGGALSDPFSNPNSGRRKRLTLSVEKRIESKREDKPAAEGSRRLALKGLAQPAAEGSRKISLSANNNNSLSANNNNGEGKKHNLDSTTLKDSPAGQPKAPQMKPVQGEAKVSLASDSGHHSDKNDVSEEGHSGRAEVQKAVLPDQVTDTPISKTANLEKPPPTSAKSFLPAYVVDQVGKQIARSLLKGNRVIQLQLKPPDLGTIKVVLDMQHDSLKLEMVIENASVKELLKSNIHELRASLVEQGVKLAKVDVQINYDFGQSPSNSQESFKGPQQGNQGLNGEPAVAENEGEDSQTESLSSPQNDHLLNLVA